MGNESDNKYIKKNSELDMNITLKEYILFPGTKIEGAIELIPKNDMKIQKEQKILFKLTQFQKYEFLTQNYKDEIQESSDSKEILIIDKNITKAFSNEYLKKKTKIEFCINLPADENKYFYPTFEFRKNDINIFIRHLLTIELPDLGVANSTGIIILKLPEKQNMNIKKDSNIYIDKKIKNFLISDGKFSCGIRIKKLSFSFDEEIPIKLDIDSSELIDLKIENIEFILQKKIFIKSCIDYKYFNLKEERMIVACKKYEGAEVQKKNFQLLEKLKLNKSGIPDFSEIIKERFTKFNEHFTERDDQRMILNPSVNTDLFGCEYKIKINIHFNHYDINKDFVIDLYNTKPSLIDDYLNHYFICKENPLFDSNEYKEKEKDDHSTKGNDKEEKKKTEDKDKKAKKDMIEDFEIID